MKSPLFVIIAVVCCLALLSDCKKKKGSDGCSTEEPLQVTTTPAINSTEPPSPGSSFPLSVSITSALPVAGVTITIKARPENSQTAFYNESRNSGTAINNFIITGTPVTTPAIVEITVTSSSCSTNRFTGSYRYSRK